MHYGLDPHSLWYQKLSPFWDSDTFHQLTSQLAQTTVPVYPPQEQILRAFALTPFDQVKVVLLGQDPYHGKGQAHGLAFSVEEGVRIPPSLRNIYKELESDCHITPPSHGDLSHWAEQGVLLLNTCLTVEEGKAGSHHKLGWEQLTHLALSALQETPSPLVFLLWGNPAQRKRPLLTAPHHLVLTASHPSPLSARHSFFGCQHFSKTNQFLSHHHIDPIHWG